MWKVKWTRLQIAIGNSRKYIKRQYIINYQINYTGHTNYWSIKIRLGPCFLESDWTGECILSLGFTEGDVYSIREHNVLGMKWVLVSILTIVQASPGEEVLGLELDLLISVGQELGSWPRWCWLWFTLTTTDLISGDRIIIGFRWYMIEVVRCLSIETRHGHMGRGRQNSICWEVGEECGRVEAGESLRGQKLGPEKTNKSKSPVIWTGNKMVSEVSQRERQIL